MKTHKSHYHERRHGRMGTNQHLMRSIVAIRKQAA